MPQFSEKSGVLANTTLIIELVKRLSEKGLFDDEDWRAVLQGSLNQLQTHEDGEEATNFIAEFSGLKRG